MYQTLEKHFTFIVVLGFVLMLSLATMVYGADNVSGTGPDRGIIGGVFHVVGDVLAFPFRMAGSVLDAIF